MKEHDFKISADNSLIPGTVVERDGVHFGFYAVSEQPYLLLYKKGTQDVEAKLPFPKAASGCLHAMKVKMRPALYEYNFMDGDKVLTDPYAAKIVGRETFGKNPSESEHAVRGAFCTRPFDWGDDTLPGLDFSDVIMYHLHVRGFTMQKNSGVRKKGTFAGLREKIPYLKSLGINQVKLMPVYEFEEVKAAVLTQIGGPKTQEEAKSRMLEQLPEKERYKTNFWGYGKGYYFAVKSSYASGQYPEDEFKCLVKDLHAEGIEVILEFNFTDETDIGMITSCLYYWAREYHVDGFAIIARDTLTPELAKLPLFRTRKLICNWYPDYAVQKNAQELHYQIASSNDGFMNDCRRLLKGEEEFLGAFAYQMRRNVPGCAGINYMTNHDGFTLCDLVSYDRKHNEDNKEMNRDGSDYNYSWNCGEEGPSRKREIQRLRQRQRKNAYAMMLFSQGTPMLLAGDEFGNSQNGNNNPYCHDNEITWVDWNKVRSNQELTKFVQCAIAYRKAHKVLHQMQELKCADRLACGFPDLSFHGTSAWYGDFDHANRHIGAMYYGAYAKEDGFVYLAWNFDWQEQQLALPLLPPDTTWYKVMDTSEKDSFIPKEAQKSIENRKYISVPPRTVLILEGR